MSEAIREGICDSNRNPWPRGRGFFSDRLNGDCGSGNIQAEELTMSTIPADIQMRVAALLGTGRYASEEEILRAAVTALEVQDSDLASIQAGVKDMEAGRYRLFTDFDAEFRRRNQIGSDE
jgi:Arc/MetJ-type ribon-helix-helix transcriptional regulator